MTLEVLDYLSKFLFRLTSIPVRIYSKEKLEREYPASLPDRFNLPLNLDELLNNCNKASINISKQSLMTGVIKCQELPYHVVLGPVKSVNITNALLRDMLIENNFSLEDADKLKKQLDDLPLLRYTFFSAMLAVLYCNINHEIIEPPEPALEELDRIDKDEDLDQLLIKQQEQITFGQNVPHNTYEYEQKMVYCVKNGLVEELHKLGGTGADSHIARISLDPLRHYKNLLMAQKTLILRAAIEGGLDPEIAYSLSDIYSQKIEDGHTLNELGKLSYAIRDDFTKRVRDIKYPRTQDLTINKAIRYIIENIQEKITATEIAEKIGVSREYLSAKFKKETNMTIPEFINEQKISVACKLLRHSEKPLSEIASYLSFSSQSHFQTQFKKIMAITPFEYKNSIK